MFAVELEDGEPVKPVQGWRVLAEDSKKGDSNVALLSAVATDTEEYVPGSNNTVDGRVMFGVAGIDI